VNGSKDGRICSAPGDYEMALDGPVAYLGFVVEPLPELDPLKRRKRGSLVVDRNRDNADEGTSEVAEEPVTGGEQTCTEEDLVEMG
jgi:hypothetical protein